METQPASINNVNRDQRELSREYVTVPLSDTRVKEYKFRCYMCGRIVQTLSNKPVTIIQSRVDAEQVDFAKKIVGGLCKDDNIMFLFI